MVLLKGHGPDGFVFYTNLESRKARALARHPHAALTFYWPPQTQVRVEGTAERVTDAEADAYFATRPRGPPAGVEQALRQPVDLARQAAQDRPPRRREPSCRPHGDSLDQVSQVARRVPHELPRRPVTAPRPQASSGAVVTRPPFWSGYRVVPSSIEFWTRDVSRLHERIVFTRVGGEWTRSLVFP